MRVPIISRLSFKSREVENDWKKALYHGVNPIFHGKRLAEFLVRQGNLQDIIGARKNTFIHRKGVGEWNIFQCANSRGIFKRTHVLMAKTFHSEECNPVIAEFAEQTTAEFIANAQNACRSNWEQFGDQGDYLNTLMDIIGPDILTCTASENASKRITNCIKDCASKVFYGSLSQDEALDETKNLLERLKAAQSRSVAA
ncbi:MAG: hypothetical protein JKY50_00975 [Oleispira sp.]|nr:hypothetical protein [Oleispira sp.]